RRRRRSRVYCSYGDRCLDVRMRVVAFQREILEAEGEHILDRRVDTKLRERSWLATQLLARLLEVVEIKMTVATGPYEITRCKVASLRDHVGEQCVRRDVEWHPQEDVRAALVELAGQAPICDIELEQGVARRKRHVVHFTRIPGRHQVAPGGGVASDPFDQASDLVDVAPALRLRGAAR